MVAEESKNQKHNDLLVIQIIYPGHIYLPQKSFYFLNHKEKLWSVMVQRYVTGLEIIDLRNVIEHYPVSNENSEGVLKIRFPIDVKVDRAIHLKPIDYKNGDIVESFATAGNPAYTTYTSRNFTELVLQVEVEKSEYRPNFPMLSYQRSFRKVLNKWIKYYRAANYDAAVVTTDQFTFQSFLAQYCVIPLTDEDALLSPEQRLSQNRKFLVLKPFFPVINSSLEWRKGPRKIGDTYKRMISLIQGKAEIPNHLEIFLKAQQEFIVNKNYKYCLLDCAIAIESMVSEYLSKKKLAAGVSSEAIAEFKSRVDVSYKISVELPCFILGMGKEDKELLIRARKINRIRNDVVHEAIEVQKEDAIEAMDVLHKLGMLIEKSTQIDEIFTSQTRFVESIIKDSELGNGSSSDSNETEDLERHV